MTNDEQKLLKKLAQKIKYQRNELGISQEKLAEKCDFDRIYISLLERAKRNPSYLSLKKLCHGLEIELSYEKIIKHLGFGSKSALYSFVKCRKGLFMR